MAALASLTMLLAVLLGPLLAPLTAAPAAATAVPAAATAAPAAAASGAGPLDVARVEAFVGEQVRRNGLPGLAMGLVEGDRVVGVRGFGMADGTGRPVRPQTPFLLASISKPLTATAVLQLVEGSRVALDEPVQRYVPEFRMADPDASRITVRQLLEHTSGIPVTSCDTRRDATTLAEYVAELRTVRLAAPPGARHSYCSGNYNLLGRVVEKVTGQSYGDYVQQHVFGPLGMRHSFTQEAAAERDGLAQGHRWLFGHAAAAHERYNTSQLPSGFLVSSAEDMTHFVVAQLNGGRYGGARILSAATVAAMQAPGVPIGTSGARYGLGWKTALLAGVPVVEHSGDNFYYHGLVFLEPATRRGAVLLTNSNGLVASQAYTEIEHGVARLLAGQATGPSSMSLRTLYLLVDLVLAIVLALALWPLLRMHRWSRKLVARRRRGRPVRLRLALRAGAEIGLPVLVLVAARLALRAAGGQSWGEGLSLLPDTGAWLWTLCVVVLLTGVLRLAVARHAARPAEPAGPLDPVDPAEPVDPVGPVGTRPATAPGAAG